MNTNSHTERYTQLINLYLILPSGELSSLTSIYIDSSTGIICNPPSISSSNKIKDIKIIDLNGKMISPGLIDIQINGAFGVDLSEFENTQKYIEGLKKMSKRLCEFGITSFLPTIISQKNQKYQSILPILKQVTNLLFDKSDEMARSLGWHLEGPFINPCKSGCHPTINFVNASNGIKSLKEMYGDDNLKKNEKMIKMITLAPEIKGILDVMPFLVRMNGKLAWVILMLLPN
ncbi:uncharacterized protein I206_100150 [Kwoniella pini CBS 10737]|uniref:N-acetylglucosamine-6-phosphate deacetylase n=1 Tax=Kwoniella pini CBS 10737 TaxID=1296096 RepID=A0AAJ8KWS2_9TREE